VNPVQDIECTLISFDPSDCKLNASLRALSVGYMWLVSSLTLIKNMT